MTLTIVAPQSSATGQEPHGGRGRPRRAPGRPALAERKRLRRTTARRLVRSRARIALTAEQRAGDPLDHGPSWSGARPASALGALLLAAALHVGIVVMGAILGGQEAGRREKVEQVIKVEMREPPPPPPPSPPVEEKKAEPPRPEPIVKPVRPPPLKKASPPPPAPPRGPPPRVVGLSLDSTTEAGGGPTFAVGETHLGATDARAQLPPREEAPAGTGAPTRPPAPPATNHAASRIPVEGVRYTPPKMKTKLEPIFPETLKAQGLEADVTVLVSIDVEGNVTDVKIIKESPYPGFNQAARAAALRQKFEPELRGGLPIAATLSWVYRFRLDGP